MRNNLKLLPLSVEDINGLLKGKINTIEEVFNKEILEEIGLKQCIIYNYDSLAAGEISEVEINQDNIMEAKFFNDKVEIDVINDEGIKGHISIEENNNLVIEEEYEIYHSVYNKLKVKKYIALDEHNQGYIYYLKPCNLYRKEQK